MVDTIPIKSPAGFVPEIAVAYGDGTGTAIAVDGTHPLPVRPAARTATVAPLSGVAAASATVGPYVPDAVLPLWLTLSGSWTGSVTVMRSIDGGATLLPLTAAGVGYGRYTANAQEPVTLDAVAGVTYWLVIALTSGSVGYRVQQ